PCSRRPLMPSSPSWSCSSLKRDRPRHPGNNNRGFRQSNGASQVPGFFTSPPRATPRRAHTRGHRVLVHSPGTEKGDGANCAFFGAASAAQGGSKAQLLGDSRSFAPPPFRTRARSLAAVSRPVRIVLERRRSIGDLTA